MRKSCPADGSTHQQTGEKVKSEHANISLRGSSSSSENNLQTILHKKNGRPTVAFVADLSQGSDETENSASMYLAGAESLEKPGIKSLERVDHCLANSCSSDPVNNSLACAIAPNEGRGNGLVQCSNARIASLDSASSLVACMSSYESFPNATSSGPSLVLDTSIGCEEEMDCVSLPWGEIDAAFLFLFLWETQEQDCQEALERWCIDPFIYNLFFVQDMAVLLDYDKKAGCVRAPRWRERLQQYLQQNVLQVGYGFPGIMASPNLSPSLSPYIDTIGKFQRILETMEVEEDSEQRLPAASAAALHSLPATVIGLCSEDKGKVCIICKEELEPLSIASQFPCMHVYHWDCIFSWLKQRNNCPVCRHELPSDDYDHELQKKIQILKDRAI
ncbi:hypothetical protein L7F22_059068 [Adiantum nelumboides]|nr:hypothetical protein [Adiantum nelumboides]